MKKTETHFKISLRAIETWTKNVGVSNIITSGLESPKTLLVEINFYLMLNSWWSFNLSRDVSL